MFSRSVGRVIVESPWRVPPVFLLPLRARLSTTASAMQKSSPIASIPTSASTPPVQQAVDENKTPPVQPAQQASSSPSVPYEPATKAAAISPEAVGEAQPSTPKAPLPESVTSLLPSLVAQPPHYATMHIHARPYLVTEGDIVRLPFKMPDVTPGDVLRLNRASLIGSRDFTLRGEPYVDDRLFECRAVVMSVESEPMRFMEKTKRRNRRVKTVKSKHKYTEIAIKELKVKDLDEIEL